MRKSKWYISEDPRTSMYIDETFKRRIFVFCVFSLLESIHITRENESQPTRFRYFRGFGVNEKYYDNKIVLFFIQ